MRALHPLRHTGLLLLAGCISTAGELSSTIPASWLAVPATDRIEALSYQSGLLVRQPPPPSLTTVHVAALGSGVALFNGEKVLTPPFSAIDSFSVSVERKEVVFSARRMDNFDVGLVSVDGSDVHWVPADPADETDVQWAPKGNKISFTVRSPRGDLVRTVHIPTSVQLTVEFPDGHVNALAWNPSGDQFAVAWNSLDGSDRVEAMLYGGEGRTLLIPPAVLLDVQMQPIGAVPVLRPSAMHYGEMLPLVVWKAPPGQRWSDARGILEKGSRVACAVVDRVPDDKFWQAIAKLPWIDHKRTFIVGLTGGPADAETILADDAVPAGRYRRAGNVVYVAPSVVESFAGGSIADSLKGNPPANGSKR